MSTNAYQLYLLSARNSTYIKFNTHQTSLREEVTALVLELINNKVYKENTQCE